MSELIFGVLLCIIWLDVRSKLKVTRELHDQCISELASLEKWADKLQCDVNGISNSAYMAGFKSIKKTGKKK